MSEVWAGCPKLGKVVRTTLKEKEGNNLKKKKNVDF